MTRDRNQGRLFAIIGPDGAGKTTLTKTVVKSLNAGGYSTEYVWCRFESRLLALALKAFRKIIGFGDDVNASYVRRTREKSRFLKYRVVRMGYLLFVVLVYVPRIHRLARKARKEHIVVADRYFYDTIVDLWVDFGAATHELSHLVRLFQLFFSEPNITYLLDVPAEISVSRKDDIPCIDYVATRRRGYLEMAKIVHLVRLDGTLTVDENSVFVHDTIARRIEE